MSTDVNESFELAGPEDDRWYRTQIPDWIALNPELKDGAFRLYCILRALILEKQKNRVRVLSHEQIAFLSVGKNGKPTSISTVKVLLANLQEVGLVTNPDGSRIVTSSGPGTIRSRRRYQLADWPNSPEAYTGWRNAFDKLDAFTDDWRQSRTDVPPGQVEGQFSNLDGQKTGGHGQKSNDDGQKTGKKPPLTSNDAPSLKEFPEGGSSSSAGAAQSEGGAPATPEEEETPQEKNTPPTPERTGPDAREVKAAAIVASRLADAEGGAPTPQEIPAVLEHIRDEAAKTRTNIAFIDTWVSGRGLGTLKRDLAAVRARQATPQAPTPSGSPAEKAPARERATCPIHRQELACLPCKGDLAAGGVEAQAVLDSYFADPDARPDLKSNRYILRALAAA